MLRKRKVEEKKPSVEHKKPRRLETISSSKVTQSIPAQPPLRAIPLSAVAVEASLRAAILIPPRGAATLPSISAQPLLGATPRSALVQPLLGATPSSISAQPLLGATPRSALFQPSLGATLSPISAQPPLGVMPLSAVTVQASLRAATLIPPRGAATPSSISAQPSLGATPRSALVQPLLGATPPLATAGQPQIDDSFKEFWKKNIGEKNETCGNVFFAQALKKEYKNIEPVILLVTYTIAGREGRVSFKIASTFFSCFGNDALINRFKRIHDSLFDITPTSSGQKKLMAPWFYGFLHTNEANDILQKSLEGNFLVRFNHRQAGRILLSYFPAVTDPTQRHCHQPRSVQHIVIDWDKNVRGFVGWFWIDKKYASRLGPYANIKELVDYLTTSKYLSPKIITSPLSREINSAFYSKQCSLKGSPSLFNQAPSDPQQPQPNQQGVTPVSTPIKPPF
jgi:hypothetical protein